MAAAAKTPRPRGGRRRAKILIAADSPALAERLRGDFAGAGYTVRVARNGAEALAMARSERPVAVVGDTDMSAMDGYALCHELRNDAATAVTPVILLTGPTEPLDVIRRLNAGADGYLSKPYAAPILLARIEALLALPPAPPPPVERRKLEIRVAGQTHTVDAHGPRLLNLLVSAYEDALQDKTLALRASEARGRALLEYASDLVALVDARGAIAYISPSIERLGGYQPDEVLGRAYLEFAHPDDRAQAAAGFAQIMQDPAAIHTTEFRFRHRDGHWLTLESVARNALADPSVRGVVVNARDVSERRRAQAAVAASETKFRRLFEAARDGILLLDVQSGQITEVNPFMIELLGYSREQYLGRKLWEIGAFKDVAESKLAFGELLAMRYARYEDLPLRAADGRIVDVEFISNVYRANGGEVIQCNIRDMSERKRALVVLRKAKKLLQTVVENVPVRIFWKDRDLRYLGCNMPFARDAGLAAPEQLIGKTDFEMGWKDQAESYRADDAAVMSSGKSKLGFEEPQTTPDGKMIWLRTSKVPLRDEKDQVFALLGVYEDITLRKLSEQKLERLNWAMRALSQSNSALVHAASEEDMFAACCSAIASSPTYRLAWIGIARDAPGRRVEIAAAAGEAIGYMDGFEVSWDDTAAGQGPAGATIRGGAMQVVEDVAASAAFMPWLERARAHGLKSLATVPIKVEGGTFGVLAVYSGAPAAFGKEETALLEELAGDIGFGISTRRTRRAYEAGVRESAQQALKLRSTFESAIAALAATVEQRDPYTAGHQRRVAELAAAIGRELGLDDDRLEGLRIAGTIHDIGKIYIPAEILARPARLGTLEFELVKSHAQVGYDIVKGVDFPWPVADSIRQHHERLDGSGYPQGLKGDQIILEARVLAVADVVEAMSSHRPYRPGLGIDAALAQIRSDSGTKFDPDVVEACERLFRDKGFVLPLT